MRTIDLERAAGLVAEGEKQTHGERMKLQRERLHSLVDYAREHSPYLGELYRNLPDEYELTDIPVMEKADMISHFDEYVTDSSVKLAAVTEYCENGGGGELYLGRYTVLHTSGTTGKPLYMVRDDHRNKIHGQMIAQRLLKGVDSTIMDHTRHKIAAVIYAVRGSSSYESFLRQQSSVPGFERNMIAVNVLENPDVMIKKLNEFQPEMVSGYGAVLLMLAEEKKSGRLDIPVKVFVNSAEALSPENHRYVEEVFGCTVLNNYCMTEGGEIAMTQDGPELLLNEDFVIIEPVDENRQPLRDPTQWSQGILVTDLTNFVQPVIRYFVNDVVKIEQIPDAQVRMPQLLIRGRTNDVFDFCDRTWTTSGIDSIAELYEGVRDYQFVQTADDELSVRGMVASGYQKDEVLQSLAAELETYFRENGAFAGRVSYSPEPMIRKERGGKTPRYADLRI